MVSHSPKLFFINLVLEWGRSHYLGIVSPLELWVSVTANGIGFLKLLEFCGAGRSWCSSLTARICAAPGHGFGNGVVNVCVLL